MCTLGDAADVNPVIKFLRHALQTETWSVSPSVDMLPFGVTTPATVPQGSEILEGLMNNPVFQTASPWIFASEDQVLSSQVHVMFLVDEVVLKTCSWLYFRFILSLTFYCCSVLIFILITRLS
jgi:hypothetical protein